MLQPVGWTHVPIARIEDLSDAVYGAGLEATQITKGSVSGSLVFAESDGITLGSGYIDGTVGLTGPLSLDMMTFGLGLSVPPGVRHWLTEVTTGDVGVFHPGDEHDSLYTPGSFYCTMTLDAERLEGEAASQDLVLDLRTVGGTGFHPRHLRSDVINWLGYQFEQVHRGSVPAHATATSIGRAVLRAVIEHFARPPYGHNRHRNPAAHARIVDRARAYIHAHLTEPISLDAIARAAFTSRRSLCRAFADILDDTPQGYVRRLRLHRIRHDLAGDAERACTITLVANAWGMSELGRMSGWYRDLFGERPSETLSRAPSTGRRPS